MKEELYLDFDLAHSHDVQALLDAYVDFLITTVLPLHWVTEAPVSSKPNGASDKYSFTVYFLLTSATRECHRSFIFLTEKGLFRIQTCEKGPSHFIISVFLFQANLNYLDPISDSSQILFSCKEQQLPHNRLPAGLQLSSKPD